MQAVALRVARGQRISLLMGVVLLALCMALFPQACPLLALLLPLFACPLVGYREFWLAAAACATPLFSLLARGYDALYAISLFALTGLPPATAFALHRGKRYGTREALAWHIGASALGLLLVVASATRVLGGYLPTGLADCVTRRLVASGQPALPLYRLASAGVIGVPSEYRNASLLTYLIEPTLVRQLLLSFRLALETQLTELLPMLYVQASVLSGLFAGLRTQRVCTARLVVMEHPSIPSRRSAHVALAPGFSQLEMPPRAQWAVMGMGFAALPLALSLSPVLQTLGLLCYAVFSVAYQLVGASVMVSALSRRNPERKMLYGVAAGALYVLFPVALLLIGLTDAMMRLRRKLDNANEEKEDDP